MPYTAVKYGKILKYLRRLLAALTGGCFLFLFVDITRLAPGWMYRLADLQIVPMVIKSAVGGLALMALLTLLSGRWYCSALCPLGVLQDGIARVKRGWLAARGRRKALRMKYRRPLDILRYGMLIAVAVPYVLGVTLPVLVTDPYSNFGRIAAGLFRPLAVWINNGLARVVNAAGNYSVYAVNQLDTGLAAVAGAVALAALVIMVWRGGRLWCNTVCPVGTLLGMLSRFSWLRIRLNQEGCNACGQCEAACKAGCIDSKARTVDASRCVACFNCLGACRRGAIAYAGASRRAAAGKIAVTPIVACDSPCKDTLDRLSGEGLSRRRFLKGTVTALAALPAAKLLASSGGGEMPFTYPMPPGAGSRERFMRKCTACQLCVGVCPTQVLRPALTENGWQGVMQPYMHFRVESFCNFECVECLKVCPSHAIEHLTPEEKKLTRVGVARLYLGRCIVLTEHQDCGACAEHCPTAAVHMVPYEGSLTIPRVEAQYCIGCGGCQSICPVVPVQAIVVRGLDVQEMADPPKKDDFEAGQVTDFGF